MPHTFPIQHGHYSRLTDSKATCPEVSAEAGAVYHTVVLIPPPEHPTSSLALQPRQNVHIASIQSSAGEGQPGGRALDPAVTHPRSIAGSPAERYSSTSHSQLCVPQPGEACSLSLLITSLKKKKLFLRHRAENTDCPFALSVLRTWSQEKKKPGDFCYALC